MIPLFSIALGSVRRHQEWLIKATLSTQKGKIGRWQALASNF